jgi:hypothetical protein
MLRVLRPIFTARSTASFRLTSPEHVPASLKSFGHAMRLLKPGGLFVSFTPNGAGLEQNLGRGGGELICGGLGYGPDPIKCRDFRQIDRFELHSAWASEATKKGRRPRQRRMRAYRCCGRRRGTRRSTRMSRWCARVLRAFA